MTKLKLNFTPEGGEILSKEELKKIVGGKDYGSGTCSAYVPVSSNNGWGSLPTGSHTFQGSSLEVNQDAHIYRNVSRDFAIEITKGVSGAKWCCESCGSASWY